MDKKEKQNKGFAIGGTILFHALAVLILCLMAFKTPLPLPGEEGVEVNLGDSDQGMGDIQTKEPSASQPYAPPQKPSKTDEEIVTQNNNDNPAIDDTKQNKTKPKENNTSQQQQTQRTYYTPSHQNQNGGSEGITGQPGNQGNPNGDLSSMNYDGNGGSGNGQGTFNENRGYKHLVTPPDDFKKEGDIAVDVWVNRGGQVTKAEINRKKSTIDDVKMQNEAIDAAKRSSFVPDPNALETERRTIIYHYIKKA